jgi:ABC-type branched-subunit amino acid transport system ATPase component
MKYVDFVYVLSAGSVVASATPREIVEMGKLYEVYLA